MKIKNNCTSYSEVSKLHRTEGGNRRTILIRPVNLYSEILLQ